MKKLEKTAIIALSIILAALLTFIIFFVKPWNTTAFWRYKWIDNKNYKTIEIDGYEMKVPVMWLKNSITPREVSDNPLSYYDISNNSCSEFENKTVTYQDESNFLLFKEGEFYIQLSVIDPHILPEDEREAEIMLDNMNINNQDDLIRASIEVHRNADDQFKKRYYTICDENMSLSENGYLRMLRTVGNKLAVLLVSVNDEIYDKYPCIDKFIADSLTQMKGE